MIETADLLLDERLYPREAVHGASYLFLDRCYVFLTRPEEGKFGVRLKARQVATPPELEALAGDFANELLNQVVRIRVGESTAKIRERYMARAFQTDGSRAAVDAIVAELEREEPPPDPLRIAIPWDERAKKADGHRS